jgi:hypothetical protein
VGRRLDYLARYTAVVVAQTGDNLSCKPDDSRLPTLVGVKLRYGIPGLVLQVAPGARVLIGFDAGDPTKPFAELWSTTVPISLALTAATSVTLAAPTITMSGALAIGAMSPSPAASTMELSGGAKPVAISSATAVGIDALAVTLGGGIAPVARVGDAVVVDPVTHIGTITSGSAKVFA